MAALDFYFDVVSPYAYLAWWRARKATISLMPRPVLLSALLEHSGTRGPAEIASKRASMIRDVMRRADAYGAPLQWPMRHPFSTVAAARLVLAVADAPRRANLVDALFAAVWVDGAAIDEAQVLGACADRAGLTTDERRWAEAGDAKAGLYAANAAAIAAGVFGVPTFGFGDEVLFGDDQIPVVLAKLAGNDSLDHRRAAVASAIARPVAVVPSKRGAERVGHIAVVGDATATALAVDGDPLLAAQVLEVFRSTPLMQHFGVTVVGVGVGKVETRMLLRPELLQQHGFAHAGVLATLADHTAGACATTHGQGVDVLSIEFKINMLAPAKGHVLTCRAATLRAGKAIAVVEAEVFSNSQASDVVDASSRCAKATVTLSLRQRGPRT